MPLGFPPATASGLNLSFEPVVFEALTGWPVDDHAAAYAAFVKSCAPVLRGADEARQAGRPLPPAALLEICGQVVDGGSTPLAAAEARAFFETHFTAHRVRHSGPEGLLTGYYEPELPGAREPSARFRVPVLRRPPDLVNMVTEAERGNVADRYTHMRQTNCGLLPYWTRQQIEQGALVGQGLEFLWLPDEVDTFFMHIQGSGRIRLPDGTAIRVTYDGKNGHPYTSIGRYLIDAGLFAADRMSLDALKVWLKENAARGREVMWVNKSFVFFRELSGAEAESAMGVMEIPLSEGRSLAVDTAFHAIGTPVFVTSPGLTHAGGDGFRRLMIAQDVGSAIRGPERGDIYFGSGDAAGALAGITKHPGTFTVLLPKVRS